MTKEQFEKANGILAQISELNALIDYANKKSAIEFCSCDGGYTTRYRIPDRMRESISSLIVPFLISECEKLKNEFEEI